MDKKYLILLCEDNKDHQKLLSMYLENTGYDLDIASDGKELLRKLQQGKKYDLVLLDIQLPEIDGYTITEIIRKNKKNKHLIIIGLSAFAMKGDNHKAINKGMNDYLSKPVDKKTLLNTINKYLKPSYNKSLRREVHKRKSL